MDEPDIPMLDVGDFEVLDECVGEDDNEDDQDARRSDGSDNEDDDDNDHVNPKRRTESARRMERADIDENSGDNGDNILDVSIDVSENEFLENVAKDFSENIEDDVEDSRPRNLRSSARKGQPTVQIRRLAQNIKKTEDEPVSARKKPGPRSKTMNIQMPPVKKVIQKINFSDDTDKKENKNQVVNQNQKNTNTVAQKNTNTTAQKNTNTNANTNANAQKNKNQQQNVQQKTPAFLKKDLTDEEIMIHFDEIENTVLTSDSFVIQNEVENAEKEEPRKEDENKGDNKNEENQDEDKAKEEENWDETCDSNVKKQPKIKIEEEELKESEMWYKEKIKAKEASVEERFTKLAKIIQYSYPLYKKWLDRNESLFGTAICKVESSKHSSLDQLHPNRWKFICNKKHNQQSTKEEDKQADNTSDNKSVQSNWQMIPGVPDANVENTEEYPPFVMRVVKIFEEFLQSLEESSNVQTEASKDESENDSKDKEETKTTEEEKPTESDKTSIKTLDGLTVLLRCNRKDDLMMHITGKNISSDLMDKIKDLFENGPGKDCNLKSLYCKTIIKENNVIKTNNTFLFGTETLDDNIGPVKIQLAPKSNVWPNLSGVEILANVVAEYLVPTKKTTVLEVGCGAGLISLLLASKCQKVIGIDVQKEIVEAEITCELNEIKNATFVTGKPKLVMAQINKALTNLKAVAVINTSNTFGRSIEVISALRKMTMLGRIVIITTLTKQAIRSILELTQPADDSLGNPFIPIKACIVDTTPKGYGFEIVMSMERRTMRNLLKVSPVEGATTNPVGLISKSKQQAAAAAALKFNAGGPPFKKGMAPKFIKGFKPGQKPGFITGKKFFPNPNFNPAGKFQGKRPFPVIEAGGFQPGAKKFKQFDKPWLAPNMRPNPMHDKMRDEGDLREKLSSGRVEPVVIAQEVQEQKKLLDAAREKLTVAGSSVDVETVKKLQEMLNLAIEKTNKLQSQLPPRSVWDRIAPPDTGLDEEQLKSNPPMRGRLIKETGPKALTITTTNSREFQGMPAGPGKSKKYANLPPLEPNLIMPVNNKPNRQKMTQSVHQKPNTAPYQKPGPNRFQSANYRKPQPANQPEPWNRNKQQPPPAYSQNEPQERWSRPTSPPRRSSPPRGLLRSPPRQASPPRRPISPVIRRPVSPPRRPVSPQQRRPQSPIFRQHSSSSRGMGGGRQLSPPRRHSPPRRPISPHNYRGGSPPRQSMPSKQKSPPPRRYADEWDIPSRGAAIAESGWSRPEKEKTGWQQGPPTSSSSSNWNQRSSNYRPESDNWDNPTPPTSWNNKSSQPLLPSPNSRWKSSSGNTTGLSNWDVKKDPVMRDSGRHESRNEPRHEPRHEMRHEPRNEPRLEPRHEPRHEMRHEARNEPRHESRHETRHEPRWEPPEKSFRNEKDDYGDLPEDARDPWGDDNLGPSSQKDIRWNSQISQPSQPSAWPRDKPNDNWSNKQSYPLNSMGGGGSSGNSGGGILQNPNMNMNMNMGMSNPSKSIWQGPSQSQQQQPNRNTNWLPPGNWQSGSSSSGGGGGGGNAGGGVGMGGMILGNALNNWQPPQQNYSNFSSRPFNSNPFISNRR